MSKKLSEMSLEELWELFPIYLTEQNEKWDDYYTEAESTLTDALAQFRVRRVSHIGSTAIKGIWAKPIIDILVELEPGEDMDTVSDAIIAVGFIRMSTSEGRASFNRGYTDDGFAEKVYHLHLRYAGDNDELYFRDYMNSHPEAAKEYERLKLETWKKFEHDRDGYTAAKTGLVRKYTVEAKMLYAGRYA